MKHQRFTPEWIEFNSNKLTSASNELTRRMNEAGLLPEAQERLRKAFQFATNESGMKQAIKMELRGTK